jgi:rare lipoprotein A
VYLQLGAFKTQEAAEAYLAKMRSELGDNGKQLKLTNKDGLVRVHIGPYSNQSEARLSADSLESKLGFKPMVNLQ